MFFLQAPGLPFSCPVCSRRSAVSLSFTTVSSLIIDRSIWGEADGEINLSQGSYSSANRTHNAASLTLRSRVEVSAERRTNLPYSLWTRHLNPLPSCFLLECQQHVPFFQQHIPETGRKHYSQQINPRVVLNEQCDLCRPYQSLCKSSLLFALSCLAVHGAPTKNTTKGKQGEKLLSQTYCSYNFAVTT